MGSVGSANARTSNLKENTVNATWGAVLASNKSCAQDPPTASVNASQKKMSPLANVFPGGPARIAVVPRVWSRV